MKNWLLGTTGIIGVFQWCGRHLEVFKWRNAQSVDSVKRPARLTDRIRAIAPRPVTMNSTSARRSESGNSVIG